MLSNSFNCFLISFDNKSLFCGSNLVGVGCGEFVLVVEDDELPDVPFVGDVSSDEPKLTEICENIKIMITTNRKPITADSLTSILNFSLLYYLLLFIIY